MDHILLSSHVFLPSNSIRTLWNRWYCDTIQLQLKALDGVIIQDLHSLCEAFSLENDENGDPIFLYSSFGYFDKDLLAYSGRSDLRKYHLTPREIQNTLKLLPDDDVYPEAPINVTIASVPIDDGCFVKRPSLNTTLQGTGLLPKLISREVEVLELLMRNPHPNISRYRGCIVRRGRIVGLVFDRLSTTLYERVEECSQNFDTEVCMESVTSVVRHLHSLGLAHNDLNPSNIMFDESDNAFVIDYGSCRPFGEDLISAGTEGWIDEFYTTSAQKHDDAALAKIQTWLESQRDRPEPDQDLTGIENLAAGNERRPGPEVRVRNCEPDHLAA